MCAGFFEKDKPKCKVDVLLLLDTEDIPTKVLDP